jgi:dipeptidyl aminopeptidase/acylaminoacyl peptidase
MKSSARRFGILFGLPLLILLLRPSSAPLAASITVTSANPNNAPQGTVNLNVTINGSGFKKGAIAKWFVSGTTNPGGVTVNSTAFVSSSQLTANINISTTSPTTSYDIVVTLTDGSSGKGTKLFAVTAPDPAIAFTNLTYNNLYVMNADGTNQLGIYQAPTGACVRRPDWSPDHSQLVFEMATSCTAGTGDGIYVINKDGSGLRMVIGLNVGDGLSFPVWSPQPAPDGYYKIAFGDQVTACGAFNLFLVNLDGSGLTNLTPTCSTTQNDHYWPTWDSSATRLAAQVYPCPATSTTCSGTAHLHEFNLGQVNGVVGITGETDLTASGPLSTTNIYAPEWAKTHDEIVLQANYTLWIVSLANPGNPVALTATTATYPVAPSWSPDDSKIVYRGLVGNNKDGILVINADGSGVTVLATSGDQPRWRRCCPTCTIVCSP